MLVSARFAWCRNWAAGVGDLEVAPAEDRPEAVRSSTTAVQHAHQELFDA